MKLNELNYPPPPTPIESGGTYACSPSQCTPLSGGKYIPPISGINWLPLAITKKTPPFPGLSREIFPRLRPKVPPFTEKMGTCMRSIMHSSWGGGGGEAGLIRRRSHEPTNRCFSPARRRVTADELFSLSLT